MFYHFDKRNLFTSVISSSLASLDSFLSISSWSLTSQFSSPYGLTSSLLNLTSLLTSVRSIWSRLGFASFIVSWYTEVRYIDFDSCSKASSVAGLSF